MTSRLGAGDSMRILHVVPTYLPAVRYGGPIRAVHGLCKALAELGHSVTVMTTNVDGSGDADVPLNQSVKIDAVDVRYFRSRFLRRTYWAPGLKRALRKSIGEYDVVHLHSVFLWPTWVAARTASKASVPYVMTPHGMLVSDLIERKSRLVKRAWIHFIEKRSIAEAAAIQVTSEIERREIEKLGFNTASIVCVYNGIDFVPGTQHPGNRPGFVPRYPYLLFLSRLNWKKGLDRLIKALAVVPEVRLVIAGNDEDGYQRQIENLAREVGVLNRVEFIGAVNDSEKWALYENAKLFVLPSYSENFGIVVLEAMAMGCPVIVTPEVGLASVIRASQCGLVVSGDRESLAHAIVNLLKDPARRIQMGALGQNVARKEFSWSNVAKKMESVYQDLLVR